jgi:3-hydroxyacyl-CoA dehydrogenase
VSEVARACGKNPVVVRTTHGVGLRRESRLRDDSRGPRRGREGVATREHVNQLMVDCFRWPVGPFAMVEGATSGWK